MKSVLLRLDDRLAERLELMNRVLGGAGTRGGKKSAIVFSLTGRPPNSGSNPG